jgi:hypothetical protein
MTKPTLFNPKFQANRAYIIELTGRITKQIAVREEAEGIALKSHIRRHSTRLRTPQSMLTADSYPESAS